MPWLQLSFCRCEPRPPIAINPPAASAAELLMRKLSAMSHSANTREVNSGMYCARPMPMTIMPM